LNNRAGGLRNYEFLCFVQKVNQKLVLFKSKDFRSPQAPLNKGGIKGGIKRWGIFRGRSPQTEIWVIKAEGLKIGWAG